MLQSICHGPDLVRDDDTLNWPTFRPFMLYDKDNAQPGVELMILAVSPVAGSEASMYM